MIAIFTFLFTVIMANIVSYQPLNNIFARDINDMKSTIQKMRRNYVITWILFIVIVICVIELVSVDPTVPKLIRVLKSIGNIC